MMTINNQKVSISSQSLEQMLYVHIPFCDKKCYYCDFVSSENKSNVDRYFLRLEDEIKMRKNKKTVTSVFIGGGTPTSVDARHISKILSVIKENYILSKQCEITIEANPKSTTRQKLEAYFKSGINRISFGVQSLDEKQLEVLGRFQTKKQVEDAINSAKDIGFKNISADLMLGLPGQTKHQVVEHAKQLTDLGITHFSAYMLILEKGTKLDYLVKNQDVILPSDDETVEIYNRLFEFLKKNKFERYEVSNFAKDNLISHHNLGYWQMKEYIGFGLAAHSFENMQRKENSKNLMLYLQGKDEKIENISKEQEIEEIIMLGLRTKFGVKKEFVENSPNFNMLVKERFVFEENRFIKVCPDKFGVLNSIILKLVE